MQQRGIDVDVALVACGGAAEVAEPRDCALNFPAPFVASERSAVLGARLFVARAV